MTGWGAHQFKPWQRLPALACEHCPARATHRVRAATWTEPVDLGGGFWEITVTDLPDIGALTCAEHAPLVAAGYCAEHGGAGTQPLRLRWRDWLRHHLLHEEEYL